MNENKINMVRLRGGEGREGRGEMGGPGSGRREGRGKTEGGRGEKEGGRQN